MVHHHPHENGHNLGCSLHSCLDNPNLSHQVGESTPSPIFIPWCPYFTVLDSWGHQPLNWRRPCYLASWKTTFRNKSGSFSGSMLIGGIVNQPKISSWLCRFKFSYFWCLWWYIYIYIYIYMYYMNYYYYQENFAQVIPGQITRESLNYGCQFKKEHTHTDQRSEKKKE
jgi:hypothetical protein